MKIKIASLGLAVMLITTGCTMLPSPGETIKPPAVSDPKQQADDVNSQIQKLLPSGAKLAKDIQMADIDRDGTDEALAIYEERVSNNRVLWASVFKQNEGNWNQAWKERGAGYEIDYANMIDVTGDGQREIVLGWTLGASAGNGLDIYGWNAKKSDFDLVAKTSYHNTLVIEDMPSAKGKDGKVEIAVWQKDLPSVYKVDVLRWRYVNDIPHGDNHFNLVPAEDVYPYYFAKVVKYYSDLIQDPKFQQSPEQAAVWYYLADAQLKVGKNLEALQSIEKGMAISKGYPKQEQFMALRDKVEQSVEYFKSQFQLGLSQSEVVKRFGNDFVEGTQALDDRKFWRYDYVARKGYTFPGDLMDSVDLEGIKVGFMRMQLFVTWSDDQKAYNYSLYYKDDDGNLYNYVLFPDGKEKLDQIKF
jgi:hypothetical protein